MQKLIIKNFGPIKDVELDINDFMVFIGPQASGKSTISKIIYFFKLLQELFSFFIVDSITTPSILKKQIDIDLGLFEKEIQNLLRDLFPVSKGLRNCELSFIYNHDIYIKLTIDKSSDAAIILSSGFITRYNALVEDLHKIVAESNAVLEDVQSSLTRQVLTRQRRKASKLVVERVEQIMGTRRETIFIPAGRSLFSLLKNKDLRKISENIDYTLQEFIEEIDGIRELFTEYSSGDFASNIEVNTNYDIAIADKLVHKILQGSYNSKDDFDWLEISNGESIPLEVASSGQQESIWILLILFEQIYYKLGANLFIEEPEAHLFPESQKLITDLIVLFSNASNNSVVITTHSPYILSSINNLIYAHNIGQQYFNEVDNVVNNHLWLDYKRVGAYFVENGTIRNITEDDLKMIKSEEIDTASRIINQEYDLLSDIEFQK